MKHTKKYPYISLSKRNGAKWEWQDYGSDFTYRNWKPAEPARKDFHCTIVSQISIRLLHQKLAKN